MSWYQPLLDDLWNHLLDDHKDISESDHAFEYRQTEQFFIHDEWKHAEPRTLPCPWCNCGWHKIYVVNLIRPKAMQSLHSRVQSHQPQIPM
jgi:hypothetical protein